MILVTSDVHAHPDSPERTDRFVRFISSRCRGGEVEAIYILGDLFDVWIGPRHPRTPTVERIFRCLEEATARGVAVGFIPGNRDFHLDGRALNRIGVRRLGDVHCVRTGAGRLFLTHGDQLCTRDSAYRIARAAIRSLPARIAWRALPPPLALKLATGFRSISRRSVTKKPPVVMGISKEGIRRALRGGADVIVCGHVHRQERRRVDLDGRSADLFTLADWEVGEPHLVVNGGDVYFGTASRNGN
jgi:UDP-2,3-diacylglucosamine hydrolase